ncbi:hypothetical protein [Antrihabitans stalactiti]|uniref:Uncharacterized protein n=1 Tax=Antrihabitans stalactiti TaxID=2584121 RepID=A0A848KPB0_9NOCA|nr:hypothetical protein [Antrihabitans stalactiti]NMN98774.1 hypothetical protein [Antrihabitans stalactiti]
MNKQEAGRLAEQRLDEWQRSVTYENLAFADEHSSSTSSEVRVGDVAYEVTFTVYREQRESAYTMSVRVTEVGKRSLFRSAVSRHGRKHPDGRFSLGA